MALYYISTDRGCGIRSGRDVRQVRSQLKKEVGEYNIEEVRKATEKDISWVRGMGGRIPGE